jgi:SPP1 family predicted phage head-tail adaptor
VIGKLRHQITIQQVAQVADGIGGYTESWSSFAANIWAKVEPVSTRQKFESRQLQHEVTHKILIRGGLALTSAMRIVFGARVFHIQSYRDFEERGIWTEVMACEGKPA